MIHPYLHPFKSQLAELCQQNAVRRLYAFGSVTSSAFDEAHSDVDLLVELSDDMAPEQKGEAYFQLLFGLESLFGRKVDLVINKPFRNLYFARTVEQSKELIYAA